MTLTCHLHIGMPKTGTSAIQHALHHSLRTPFTNISLGSPNQSGAFVTLFEDTAAHHMSNRILGRTPEQVLHRKSQLQKKLLHKLDMSRKSGHISDVVFSAERMSAPRSDTSIQRLKRTFSHQCTDFKVYGYLRPPLAFMISAFQQQIRLSGHNLELDLRKTLPEYKNRFEKFDHIFGRSNVSLRKFDRQFLFGNDVVQDVATQIGTELTTPNKTHANTALCLEAVALLWAIHRSGQLRRMGCDGLQLADKLSTLLAQLKGQRFGFAPELLTPVLEQIATDISWAEIRLGQPLIESAPIGDHLIRNTDDMIAVAAQARARLLPLADTLVQLGLCTPDGTLVSANTLTDWVEIGLRR